MFKTRAAWGEMTLRKAILDGKLPPKKGQVFPELPGLQCKQTGYSYPYGFADSQPTSTTRTEWSENVMFDMCPLPFYWAGR